MGSRIAAFALVAALVAGCSPDRDRVASTFGTEGFVGRPDTVFVERAPSGATSSRATEAAMLSNAAAYFKSRGFERFVIVDVGVARSRPAVWSYALRGFAKPYVPPEPNYASYSSDFMVARGLRAYEPDYHGSVEVSVIQRQLAADPLWP